MMKPLSLLLLFILPVLLTQLQGRKYYTTLTSAKGTSKSRIYQKILVEHVMSYTTHMEETAGACAISCLKEEDGHCKGFQFIEDLEHGGGECNLVNSNLANSDKSGSEIFYIRSKILLYSSYYIISFNPYGLMMQTYMLERFCTNCQ